MSVLTIDLPHGVVRRQASDHRVGTVPTLIVRETGSRLVTGPGGNLSAQPHAAIRLAV